MVKRAFETDFPTETIQEGKVKAIVPKLEAFVTQPSDYAPSKAPVFYNPVMELNRDIAVLAFQAYQCTVNSDLSICEPLTSSGIRGIRFATEIHGVKKVVISDINERAIKLAKHNVDLNGVQERVLVQHKDANCILGCHGAPRKRFNIIDIDPFGSPVPYLDSAIRSLRNKGILAATATDLAPLCGVHAKACVRKYGGKPLRTEYCHELAIRLLAGCVATTAGKHDIGVSVMFSHSTAHYIRIYAQIAYGAKKADASVKNLGYILHCFNCLHREIAQTCFNLHIEKCPECGSKMDWAGPLWLGKIFNRQFCESMARKNRRTPFRNNRIIKRLLALAKDEAEAPITYYVIDKVSNRLSSPVPSVNLLLKALLRSGFQAVPTHFNSRGVRTNAPALAVQNLLRIVTSSKE